VNYLNIQLFLAAKITKHCRHNHRLIIKHYAWQIPAIMQTAIWLVSYNYVM